MIIVNLIKEYFEAIYNLTVGDLREGDGFLYIFLGFLIFGTPVFFPLWVLGKASSHLIQRLRNENEQEDDENEISLMTGIYGRECTAKSSIGLFRGDKGDEL